MVKKYFACMMLLLFSCDIPVLQPTEHNSPTGICRNPPPGIIIKKTPKEFPVYDSSKNNWADLDFRGSDLTGFDLSHSLTTLLYSDFDDRTRWPEKKRMPEGFDYAMIMENGKNPGLGVRNLHKAGITGKGIKIAIIDQTLLTTHTEYHDRLKFYEEIGMNANCAEMHASFVASIAVGKTVGVAPDAELYYIATNWGCRWKPDFFYTALSIHRLLQINKHLPDGEKICCISISMGWSSPASVGYDQIHAAVQAARAKGILVVSSSIRNEYGLLFNGLWRDPLGDPDSISSYKAGLCYRDDYYNFPEKKTNQLMVPMDSRTTASPGGNNEYYYTANGGWSSSIPYIAGLYALARQVQPNITPEQFWDTALKTGKMNYIYHDQKQYSLGPIVDPQALINALQ